MKKVLFGLILGFVLHMLYMDCILLRQFQIIHNCPKSMVKECVKYSNATPSRFYGKYFNLYRAINWNNVIVPPWRME